MTDKNEGTLLAAVKCRPVAEYVVLMINDEGVVVEDGDCIDYEVRQYTNDELEVWKTRDDGFLFVYCNRMDIGYWVLPSNVEMIELSCNSE
jgi:hypothetical protein